MPKYPQRIKVSNSFLWIFRYAQYDDKRLSPTYPSLRADEIGVAAQTKWFFAKAKNALRVRNARSKIYKKAMDCHEFAPLRFANSRNDIKGTHFHKFNSNFHSYFYNDKTKIHKFKTTFHKFHSKFNSFYISYPNFRSVQTDKKFYFKGGQLCLNRNL